MSALETALHELVVLRIPLGEQAQQRRLHLGQGAAIQDASNALVPRSHAFEQLGIRVADLGRRRASSQHAELRTRARG